MCMMCLACADHDGGIPRAKGGPLEHELEHNSAAAEIEWAYNLTLGPADKEASGGASGTVDDGNLTGMACEGPLCGEGIL